ncbi:MAG TPA: S8 family serine peptidase, partial [Usitatibacter sp.]|nr:S8 family serine peptidase [Usitatibacter sp.]
MQHTKTQQRHSATRAFLSLSAFLFCIAFAFAPAARADVALDALPVAQAKLSNDLAKAISANSVSGITWARESYSGRMVKVLVVSTNTADSSLSDLRHAVVAAGGAVYYKYISVNGLLAMLPAARVLDIARRSDVDSISPNRMTARTASLVEKSTGAAALRASTSTTGYNGAGVGIAFLDSGIMASNKAFAGNSGASRVKKSVDLTRVNESALLGLLDWKGGLDFSKLVYPGSIALNALESTINSTAVGNQDPYGHGTLVASLAAGRAVSTTTDSAGVAPSASLYDVRVLNSSGVGDVGDALAGLDWVILHKDDYGIR